MKHLLSAALFGAVVLTSTACNSGSVSAALPEQKPVSVEATPICISATDLSAEIAHNWRRVPGQKASEATDLKYKGKALVITGRVHSLRLNSQEVDLKGDSIYLVRASGVTFSSLRPDQQVTLKCIGDGTMAPITVSSCTIEPANSPCVAERKTVPTSGPNVVHITLSPTINGDAITIAGTTDLKDGAVFDWNLEHAQQKNNPMADLTEDGHTTVKGGKYSTTVRVKQWPKGKITVWVAFFSFLKTQPQWARTQYGAQGETLEGPYVKLQSEGMKTIEIEHTITKQ
jgi:hypothetical protein